MFAACICSLYLRAGGNVAGSRFVFLRKAAVFLELALVQMTLTKAAKLVETVEKEKAYF